MQIWFVSGASASEKQKSCSQVCPPIKSLPISINVQTGFSDTGFQAFPMFRLPVAIETSGILHRDQKDASQQTERKQNPVIARKTFPLQVAMHLNKVLKIRPVTGSGPVKKGIAIRFGVPVLFTMRFVRFTCIVLAIYMQKIKFVVSNTNHMKHGFLLLIFLGGMGIQARAQESGDRKFDISGVIRNGTSGETLLYANIGVPTLKTGTTTNEYGFYSLNLPEGKHQLEISYVGFEKKVIPVEITGKTRLDIEMQPKGIALQEVEITDEKEDEQIRSGQMSIVKMESSEIKSIPVVAGEADVLKAIQTQPGVAAAVDGMAGFFVRGGGSDQNLLLLDEATVYNASHLLGFFSVFNVDAIKDVTLHKGAGPAQYGGRVSSVLDIKMNEGNSKQFAGKGGMGLLSSRLTLESPIKKDKGAFLISGRRTYLDLFLKLSPDENVNSNTLFFYDLNTKAHYQLGENDRLFLSGYFGRDVFTAGFGAGFDWGNTTGTLRWNHIYNSKLFSNLSLIFSDFNYGLEQNREEENFRLIAGIRDYQGKLDYDYYFNNNLKLKFGAQGTYHRFNNGEVEITGPSNLNNFSRPDRRAWENSAYIKADQKWGRTFAFHYGLRYSWFHLVGPGEVYAFDENNLTTPTGILNYSDGEIIKTYHGIEPRLSVRYAPDDQSALKASVGRSRQYVHQASNTNSALPFDLWVPSSNIVQPQIADQVALGYFRNFDENAWESNVEIYYKDLQNQIDFRDGADIILDPYIEQEMVFGTGKAYGAEFSLKKKKGKTTGWLAYTLSWSNRRYDALNNGEVFRARSDRRHDYSMTLMHRLNQKWSATLNWVYASGLATTFPAARIVLDGQVIEVYNERNAQRMPANHRLDVGMTWHGDPTKKWRSEWNFSIYNVYNRKNPYAVDFRPSADDPGTTEVVLMYLFPILPSLTYNFNF